MKRNRKENPDRSISPTKVISDDFQDTHMFEGILDRVNDGILSLDKNGRVLYVNQVGADLLGSQDSG